MPKPQSRLELAGLGPEKSAPLCSAQLLHWSVVPTASSAPASCLSFSICKVGVIQIEATCLLGIS